MKNHAISPASLYLSGRKRKLVILASLFTLLLFTSLYALNAGSYHLSFERILTILYQSLATLLSSPVFLRRRSLLLIFRMPRILMAIMTGISLAIAGCVMQALLKNPLVSPFTLGLSSAASFGAAMAIVFGASLLPFIPAEFQNGLIIISAFFLGLLSVLLIYVISRMKGSSSATLILSGVVIGIFSPQEC